MRREPVTVGFTSSVTTPELHVTTGYRLAFDLAQPLFVSAIRKFYGGKRCASRKDARLVSDNVFSWKPVSIGKTCSAAFYCNGVHVIALNTVRALSYQRSYS